VLLLVVVGIGEDHGGLEYGPLELRVVLEVRLVLEGKHTLLLDGEVVADRVGNVVG
jgi:hypothetical protein